VVALSITVHALCLVSILQFLSGFLQAELTKQFFVKSYKILSMPASGATPLSYPVTKVLLRSNCRKLMTKAVRDIRLLKIFATRRSHS
jgi:hypothetical protein